MSQHLDDEHPLIVDAIFLTIWAIGIAIVFSCGGCATGSVFTKHDIEILNPKLGPSASVDVAIDGLDAAFADAGVLDAGTVIRIVESSWLQLEWHRAPISEAECHAPQPGPYAGCTDGIHMSVVAQPCAQRTAVAHEVTHTVLRWITAPVPSIAEGRQLAEGDPDAKHERREFWDIVDRLETLACP